MNVQYLITLCGFGFVSMFYFSTVWPLNVSAIRTNLRWPLAFISFISTLSPSPQVDWQENCTHKGLSKAPLFSAVIPLSLKEVIKIWHKNINYSRNVKIAINPYFKKTLNKKKNNKESFEKIIFLKIQHWNRKVSSQWV